MEELQVTRTAHLPSDVTSIAREQSATAAASGIRVERHAVGREPQIGLLVDLESSGGETSAEEPSVSVKHVGQTSRPVCCAGDPADAGNSGRGAPLHA